MSLEDERMSKRQIRLVFVWGLLWLGLGGLAGLAFLATAIAGGRSAWRTSLGVMVPLQAGLLGGGVVAFFAIRSLRKLPAWQFRLPPAWALGGGSLVALAAGLGLWEAQVSRAFLMPVVAAAAATLAGLAVIRWMMGLRPGAVNARRGWVAMGLGATAKRC